MVASLAPFERSMSRLQSPSEVAFEWFDAAVSNHDGLQRG